MCRLAMPNVAPSQSAVPIESASFETHSPPDPTRKMATARERHPEAYRVSNENTRKRVRTVPMQVLSMGYSRTGTMCECPLKAAVSPALPSPASFDKSRSAS
jgi:hypothetical protein